MQARSLRDSGKWFLSLSVALKQFLGLDQQCPVSRNEELEHSGDH